jgi:hypothetical protein
MEAEEKESETRMDCKWHEGVKPTTQVWQGWRHEADDEVVAWNLELTRDRYPTKSKSRLDIQDVGDRIDRSQHDRLGNETILVTLDGKDHRSLIFGWLIMVDYTYATEKLIWQMATTRG